MAQLFELATAVALGSGLTCLSEWAAMKTDDLLENV